MTLVELQQVLGDALKDIVNAKDNNDLTKARVRGQAISTLAKNMVNNANTILHAEKQFVATSKDLKEKSKFWDSSRTLKLIGK